MVMQQFQVVQTFDLLDSSTDEPWTNSGSHYIEIHFNSPNHYHMYTDGKSKVELGGDDVFKSNLPKYNINTASTTIALSKFINLSE